MEASNVHRAITVASQANAALCVTNITGKMSADVVARSRRRGTPACSRLLLAYYHYHYHALLLLLAYSARACPG